MGGTEGMLEGSGLGGSVGYGVPSVGEYVEVGSTVGMGTGSKLGDGTGICVGAREHESLLHTYIVSYPHPVPAAFPTSNSAFEHRRPP